MSLFIILLLSLLLIIGCSFDGKTRRILFEIQSLPIEEPALVSRPIVIEENNEVIKKSTKKKYKKHKHKHKRKVKRKSGNYKTSSRANNAILAAN